MQFGKREKNHKEGGGVEGTEPIWAVNRYKGWLGLTWLNDFQRSFLTLDGFNCYPRWFTGSNGPPLQNVTVVDTFLMKKIWKLYPLDNIWGDNVCRVNIGGQTSHFYVREGPWVLGGSEYVIFYSSLNAGQIPEHFFQTGGSTTNNRLWLCLSSFESS